MPNLNPQSRNQPEDTDARLGRNDSEFRIDLDRIRFSRYFSRLSAVTQVIPQAGSGTVVHNRLTHSLKVTAVARAIAIDLIHGPEASTIAELGGCDPVVVQAAAAAHDLGHPPFGHLGEQVLDRMARERLGLPDGFEGNAQTFRILTTLDTCDAAERGLNLTAAVRAAVLKYPWARDEWLGVFPPADQLPRGVGMDRSDGAQKFSAYSVNAAEMREVKSAYPEIALHQQTIECSVMDVADDIAYSVHDLDDFYRAGVLQHTIVSAELNGWLTNRLALSKLPRETLVKQLRAPGYSLELAWRHVQAKDSWIADAEAFAESVLRVQVDLVDGLLAVPYDGGLAAERAVAAFTRHWIDRLKSSISVDSRPHVRSGHVRLAKDTWHDVVVLKFVHSRFVLDRPDLAIYQRGQARVIETLVEGFHAWLNDPDDAFRAPRRLTDSVESSTQAYLESPGRDVGPAELERLGRARAIIDYVASFTDAQATSAAALISGTSDSLWEDGRSL
ncbi:deoxyguanosinetriphosphate triphosphohydrolase family protein [Glaciibacter superstes]|uniref:deoxyguanosinetriphosphate triphosphohydrolase family protein n=1 Tax=Glaciibacter superstes TaxID=501023 RepID=UPI0003B31792|nr:dNTP triphosphohydrolase [Glaciibacter superstes]